MTERCAEKYTVIGRWATKTYLSLVGWAGGECSHVAKDVGGGETDGCSRRLPKSWSSGRLLEAVTEVVE